MRRFTLAACAALVLSLTVPVLAQAGVDEAPPIVICVSTTANEVVRSPQAGGTCKAGYTEDYAVWKKSTAEALEHITFVKEGFNKEPTVEVTNVNVVVKGTSGLGNVTIGVEGEPTGTDSLLVGTHDSASGFGDVAIGGSAHVEASEAYVFGGNANHAAKPYATVVGGFGNKAKGEESTICGGNVSETTLLLQNLC